MAAEMGVLAGACGQFISRCRGMAASAFAQADDRGRIEGERGVG